MIKTDGDRSKKRLWFAKKQLAIVKELNIPAKATNYEGFKINVWQVGDDIGGGSVTAPMGAVILCSTPDGIKIAVCDNWAGGCTSYNDLYCLFGGIYADGYWSYDQDGKKTTYTYGSLIDVRRISVLYDEDGQDLEEQGYRPIKFKPVCVGAYYQPPVGAPVLTQEYSCSPSVMPYNGSESFNVTLSDMVFLDFNNNNLPDFPYPLLDSSRNWYSSNGNTTNGRWSTEQASGANDMWKTCINLPGGSQVSFSESYYDLVGSEFICSSYFSEEMDTLLGKKIPNITHMYLHDVVPAEIITDTLMPDALRNMMLNIGISTIRPLGSYSFISTEKERITLHAAYFSPAAIPIGGEDHTIDSYFTSHPEKEKWRMFFSVTRQDVSGSVLSRTVIDSSQFYTLLQSLAVKPFFVDGNIVWERVAAMMKYLLPWPNMPSIYAIYFAWKPHDSVMFHGHDDKIYTWTRNAGSVCFDGTGVKCAGDSTFHLYVPDEVSNEEGVRPDITYAGEGYSAIYLCICNKVADSVRAVYYGYPFVAEDWHKFPDPPKYHTLVYVRPVVLEEDRKVLLGILRYAPPDVEGGDPKPTDVPTVYKFAQLTYTYNREGEWKPMAALPFPINEGANFSAALFGEDQLVQSLLNYPSPPPCNPQNIVVPYDGYASFRP